MEAPGGLLELGVLIGGQLGGSGWQQVGVGVRLNGDQRGIVGFSLALLHREERPAGFGAGYRDPPLVALGSAVGGRGSCWLLGVAIVDQRLLRCGWLPVGLGLLSLQLLLFPPDVVQEDIAVPASSPSSVSSPSPCTSSSPSSIADSIIGPRPSVCQRLGVPIRSGRACSSGPWQAIYPQSPLLWPHLILWGGDAVQESIRAVTTASCISPDASLSSCSGVGGAGGRGVLRAGGRRRRMGGRQREGLLGLWVFGSERDVEIFSACRPKQN